MNSFTYIKYRSKNPFQQLLIRRFFERCASLISKLEINSVLEVGCGEGFFLEQLHNRFPHLGLKGSDIDQLAIEYGMQRLPQFKFQIDDVYQLKEDSASFDLVIASEVLEHLDKPEEALKEINRVSRLHVLLTVPNEPIFQLCNLARMKYLKGLGNHPEHVQRWSKSAFKRLISSFFRITSFQTSFPWTIALAMKFDADS